MPKSVNRASAIASINKTIPIRTSFFCGKEMAGNNKTPFKVFYKYVLEVVDYILEFTKIDYNENR